jgi:cyclopropane-fatty-acyl-phospholipid synthase
LTALGRALEWVEQGPIPWLANMGARPAVVWPIIGRAYGAAEAQRWWSRWRMCFTACAEMWGYDAGRRWWVSYYLFSRRAPQSP